MHAAATQRLVDRNVQSLPLRTPVERCQTCTLCVYYSPSVLCLSLSPLIVVVSLPPLSSAFINHSQNSHHKYISWFLSLLSAGEGWESTPTSVITQPDTCIF